MICHQCMRRLHSSRLPSRRLFSTSYPLSAEPVKASRGPPSKSHEGPPAATSTSAAQPFSASATPSELPQKPAASSSGRVKSSVSAGTPFKGLGYMKNKDPPVAMEDHEYPDWLWGLLDDAKKAASDASNPESDLYAKSKRMRRLARRAERKAVQAAESNPAANMPQVPLEHQTIDLPGGDGSVEGAIGALNAREELNGAMRKARRKSIKEANFLKGMR